MIIERYHIIRTYLFNNLKTQLQKQYIYNVYKLGKPIILLKLLRPVDIVGFKKKRFGNNGDGGYVLVNKGLQNIEAIYGFGVGDDISFEYQFVNDYKCRAYLYDHTVDDIPKHQKHELIKFKKEGAAPEKGLVCKPIWEHIEENGDNLKPIILKIDIEGAEWKCLEGIPISKLENIQQIVMELHLLIDYTDLSLKISVLKKLRSLFHIVHVHHNNWCPVKKFAGFKAIDTLEITLVNKDIIKVKKNRTIYPTKLDFPIFPNNPVEVMDFFPYC